MSSVAKLKIYKPKVILLEFIGVITSAKWQEETLVPFFQAHLGELLGREQANSDLARLITSLNNEAHIRKRSDDDTPQVGDEGSGPEVAASVIEFVNYQLRKKAITKDVRDIQMRVVMDGFERKAIQTHVYPDVLETLKLWKSMGIKVYIDAPKYSQAEVEKFMSLTTLGNLNPLIDGIFGQDGNEQYEVIVKKLIETAGNITDLLMVTAAGGKAKHYADTFKVECVIVDRFENKKTRAYYTLRFAMVGSFYELQYVNRSS